MGLQVESMEKSIERRRQLSPQQFLEEYARPGIPVILEQVDEIQSWPALAQWSIAYFRKKFGRVPVTLYRTGAPRQQFQASLGDFLDQVEKPVERRPWYLKHWTFADTCPELLTDYTVPSYFQPNWTDRLSGDLRVDWRWIYIGGTGSGSELHVDLLNSSAWNVVITGAKKWVFYHPDDGPKLYQGKPDAFAPDLERFPLLAEATAYVGTTLPGELLFTPSLWWHQTQNVGSCIAITENFVNATNFEHVMKAVRQRYPDNHEAIANALRCG